MGKGRKARRSYFGDSIINKTEYFNSYYALLLEIAQSVFVYDDLPIEIDPLYMERLLVMRGKCAFFHDAVMGFCVMQYAAAGKLDIYKQPLSIVADAANGYHNTLHTSFYKFISAENFNAKTNYDDRFVLIYNNRIRSPIDVNIMTFAARLAELDMTIDVNTNAQKTPIIIQGEEKQMLTLENLYMNYAGNKPVTFGYKGLDLNALQVLKTDAPFVAPDIFDLKSKIWNEALTYLGVPNITEQKRERMITDEVLRMQGGVMSIRNSRLECRKRAIDQINKMFNLNVSVRYAVDFEEIANNIKENNGGVNDGGIYDTSKELS